MAEEAVQETFLRLIRQPGGLDPAKGSTTLFSVPADFTVEDAPAPCSCCGSESTKSGENNFFPRAAQAILSWNRKPCHFLLRAHLS